MKNVSIIHGWAEGPWQSQEFSKHLEKAGFKLSSDPLAADIIVAHSAGCFFVPDNIRAKVVLLIGLPFWPGKSLPRSLFEKLQLEATKHQKRRDLGWFTAKLAHNTWYIVTRPQSSWRFFKNHKQLKLPESGPKRKVILVRNKNDRFCTPDVIKQLPQGKAYEFIELPGIHDDCWLEPKAYIDLLLKEL